MKVTTSKYGDIIIRWEYPNSIVTKAFLEKKVDNTNEIIKEITIKKRYADKYDKTKAREFALTKLIKESFDRNKDFNDRVAVRNAYANRN